MEGVVRRQFELVMQKLICLRDETAIVRVLKVDVDVARKRAIFVPNQCRSAAKGDARHLSQRDLRARGSANQYAAHLFDIVTEVSLVANIDRVAFASFDVLRNALSTDARRDRGLNVRYSETVTSCFCPIDIDVDVKALSYFLGEGRSELGQPR